MANIRYPENPKVNSEAICYLSMLGSYAILFVCFCIDMMLRSEAWDFDRGFNFCLWFCLHHSVCGVVSSFAWLPACSLYAHFLCACVCLCAAPVCQHVPGSLQVAACLVVSIWSKWCLLICLCILKIFSPYLLPPFMVSEPRVHSLLDILCCAMALHVEKKRYSTVPFPSQLYSSHLEPYQYDFNYYYLLTPNIDILWLKN